MLNEIQPDDKILFKQKIKERMPELMNQLDNIQKRQEESKLQLNKTFEDQARERLNKDETHSKHSRASKQSKVSKNSRAQSLLNQKQAANISKTAPAEQFNNNNNYETGSVHSKASRLSRNSKVSKKNHRQMIDDIFLNKKNPTKTEKNRSNLLLPGGAPFDDKLDLQINKNFCPRLVINKFNHFGWEFTDKEQLHNNETFNIKMNELKGTKATDLAPGVVIVPDRWQKRGQKYIKETELNNTYAQIKKRTEMARDPLGHHQSNSMVLLPDKWAKSQWKQVDISQPHHCIQTKKNLKNEGHHYGLEWKDLSFNPDLSKNREDQTATFDTTNQHQIKTLPIDNSWKESSKKIVRAKPTGELDEWNKDIQVLKDNKRFAKRYEQEAITKNKSKMLNDNDSEQNKVKMVNKGPGDVLWAGGQVDKLDFNKKKNFQTDFENAINNNGVFRASKGFERENINDYQD